jgi:hypothetical protein
MGAGGEGVVTERLYTVETGNSARVVSRMLAVLFPDAETGLDMTYGNGRFWDGSAHLVDVIGLDINPTRASDVAGDFTALPFTDSSFDVVIFDPPYLTHVSKTNPGRMGERFGSFDSIEELKLAVEQGCREAWRVARIGVIVKVQNYIHASVPVRMTRWVETIMPHDAYGEVHLTRSNKIMDRKWGDQLSVYSNSATFLAFRHGDQRHVRRRPSLPLRSVS